MITMPAIRISRALAAGLCLAAVAVFAETTGRIANLTSRSFDVFVRSDTPADSPSVEVFTTAEGTAEADVITEFQPLFTGATSGDDYVRRQANRVTRSALTANGNTLFRVTDCEADTAYYVRIRFGGEVVWPADGNFQTVQTLPAAEWNGGARQYLVNLGRDGTGWTGTLSTDSNAAPVLAVVGDCAATNNALFFNLTDLMATNGLPLDIAEETPLTLTLYGKLATAPATTVLAGAPPAADTLVASADAIQKNLLSFMVATAEGLCSPLPGEHLLFDGSLVTCRVDQAVITQLSTQIVAYGWAGSGSLPAEGQSTSFTFAINASSSIEWLWQTNFWLEVATADHGTINPTSGWYLAGSTLAPTATPDADWLFDQWSGLASGTNPVVSVVFNQPGQLTASFAPLLVPGGDGMPAWWLTAAGLTGDDRDPNADPDHDGAVNKAEWMADTSPTNSESSLRIISLAKNEASFHLTWRGGREARQIVEVLEGSLSTGVWQPVATNLPPTETIGTCAIQLEGRPALFFRIKAER